LIITIAITTLGANAQGLLEISYKTDSTHYIVNGIEADNLSVYLAGSIEYSDNDSDGMLMKLEPSGDTTIRYFSCPYAKITMKGIVQMGANSFYTFGSYEDTINDMHYASIFHCNENLESDLFRKYHIPTGFQEFSYVASVKNDSLLFVLGEVFTPNYHRRSCIYTLNHNADSLDFVILDEGYSGGQRADDLEFNSDSTRLWLFGRHFNFLAGAERATLDLDLDILDFTPIVDIHDCLSVKWVNENELVVGGRLLGDRDTNTDHYITKLDTNMNSGMFNIIGSPDTLDFAAWAKCMDFTDSNHIYIGGTSDEENVLGPSRPNLISVSKVDSDLELKRTLIHGNGLWYYYIYTVIATSDGGVVLAGFTYDYESAPEHRDLYVLKLSADLFVDIPLTEAEQKVVVLPYPNPGTDQLNLKSTINKGQLRIFDRSGLEIYTSEIHLGLNTINTQSWPAGAYHYSVFDNKHLIDSGVWIKIQ
ncbi:MAG: T9SS type A sorting domain-containing protein, partial [Bacteroidales bacterium]|nr:T9SS type A sorting domain-containing protein [Bacteroidales bacterium]